MNSNKQIISTSLTVLMILTILLIIQIHDLRAANGPYQATGIKIGEVTDSSVIIWTRLTKYPERYKGAVTAPEIRYYDYDSGEYMSNSNKWSRHAPIVKFPNGSDIYSIEGAVPGDTGMVRVLYKPVDSENWSYTDWMTVNPVQDYTRQFKLAKLRPNSDYLVKIESRVSDDGPMGQVVEGKFKTAPKFDQIARVSFAVSTGQDYDDQDLPGKGFKIYNEILKLNPSFFVHTGDIVYYDALAKNVSLARWHWARTYSLPTNVNFHRHVASYFIKDDHDTWLDDCYPGRPTKYMGEFTFEQGLDIFLEEVPMGETTYRTIRWGRDLQIWLVEGRDFRSPRDVPDGPQKTIWGNEQKEWFKRTVKESDATFRILISPTPLVGPDRDTKRDNHSNKDYKFEGDELREFISSQENMYIVCGDRHWQYVSEDLKTGAREYSCGPASNEHAGGWKNEYLRPEHKYLNVTGGFLYVVADRKNDKPVIRFQHYGVDGELLNEDTIYSSKVNLN